MGVEVLPKVFEGEYDLKEGHGTSGRLTSVGKTEVSHIRKRPENYEGGLS